jgi:transcription elongation factor SPT6
MQRQKLKSQQRTNYLPNEAGIDADALEEITQLFGNGMEYEFAMEPSEDEEPEYTEEGEELVKEVQLKDIFEPTELQERLLTDADELIRITDEPERFQLYRLSQTPPLEVDIQKESTWISERLLAREYKRRIDAQLENAFRQSVADILGFFNNDSLEVPFVWQHRRDFLYYPDRALDSETGNLVLKALRVLIDQDDLWKVWEEDGKYRAIQQRLVALKTTWESVNLHDRVVEEAMAEVESIEDVQDLHEYVYFKYSEQIRDQQLLQNGTNGHTTAYKRAAGNKIAIWEKIRKGPIYALVKVVHHLSLYLMQAFGISAADFGSNLKERYVHYWPEDPTVTPEEMTLQSQDDYKSSAMALNGIRVICKTYHSG